MRWPNEVTSEHVKSILRFKLQSSSSSILSVPHNDVDDGDDNDSDHDE